MPPGNYQNFWPTKNNRASAWGPLEANRRQILALRSAVMVYGATSAARHAAGEWRGRSGAAQTYTNWWDTINAGWAVGARRDVRRCDVLRSGALGAGAVVSHG